MEVNSGQDENQPKKAFDVFGRHDARINRIKMDLARSDRKKPACQEALILILCRRTAQRARSWSFIQIKLQKKENEDWLSSVFRATPTPESILLEHRAG